MKKNSSELTKVLIWNEMCDGKTDLQGTNLALAHGCKVTSKAGFLSFPLLPLLHHLRHSA